jgi:palmitoyltransferase
MNCLGRGNYCYFVAMLVSLALLLSYGAYLGYMLLDEDLQQSAARAFSAGPTSGRWSDGTTFSQKVDKWIWAFATNIRVGCIGLLAVFTAPLAWGLFLYHVYLIWAGTTTNESFKWDDWKYDIADGHVYICHGPAKPALPNKDPEVEPEVDWPVSTSQRLANRALGQSLEQQGQSAAQEAGWTRVRDLSEVTNLYDLGLWHNLLDIFRVS